MIEIKLGDRYAKSVLSLAREMNLVEETRNDFALIKAVCEQNRDFVAMLKSPLIKSDKKQAILTAIFKDKLSKITSNFIFNSFPGNFFRDKLHCIDIINYSQFFFNFFNVVKASTISKKQINFYFFFILVK